MIGGVEPPIPRRLRRHPTICIVLVHATVDEPPGTDGRIRINDHPEPSCTHEVGEKRNLDDNDFLGRSLNQAGDLPSDSDMGQTFEAL